MTEPAVGAELNAAIARRVFNHPLTEAIGANGLRITIRADVAVDWPPEHHLDQAAIEPYSSDIRAAWSVVEALRERGYVVDVHGAWGEDDQPRWHVEFWVDVVYGTWGETFPEAVCRAALRALEVVA